MHYGEPTIKCPVCQGRRTDGNGHLCSKCQGAGELSAVPAQAANPTSLRNERWLCCDYQIRNPSPEIKFMCPLRSKGRFGATGARWPVKTQRSTYLTSASRERTMGF